MVKMDTPREKNTCLDESASSFDTVLTYFNLHQYRINLIKVDVPALFGGMFQEICLITISAMLAVVVDGIRSYFTSPGQPCLCQILVPLLFLGTIGLAKYFDSQIFDNFSSCTKLGVKYVTSSSTERIAQSLIILFLLLLINFTPILIDEHVEGMNFLKKTLVTFEKWHWISIRTLEMWMHLNTKLITTCIIITFWRLYMDITMSSSTLMFWNQPKVKEYEEMKKSEVLKEEIVDENQNVLMDKANGVDPASYPSKSSIRHQPSSHR